MKSEQFKGIYFHLRLNALILQLLISIYCPGNYKLLTFCSIKHLACSISQIFHSHSSPVAILPRIYSQPFFLFYCFSSSIHHMKTSAVPGVLKSFLLHLCILVDLFFLNSLVSSTIVLIGAFENNSAVVCCTQWLPAYLLHISSHLFMLFFTVSNNPDGCSCLLFTEKKKRFSGFFHHHFKFSTCLLHNYSAAFTEDFRISLYA